ncbi:MAG: diaminopimelate decarboxylase [Deltaproteobacteria bacterium]|nr:diaminopimelate decarboxylase [Deltaproteobacteria bacterium]MBW2016210.1 diaminopimelate decarboxylase [Deltaproteobacteria bacterium]MBW2129070.1 diaminopimelate decarboxylase [Deltaproteobacteria bacterium]MBW2302673.1 diaminopimelate decarboxylase [Deltaproteobacteria bacterium]
MHHFLYRDKELYCEEVPVSRIAEEVGTPFYLYSHATLIQHFRAFDQAFEGMRHLICFSMKSNSNLAILRLFVREGAGMDIVSGGELYRALKAGVEPGKIVYSGVGKRAEDMEYALQSGILLFNAESSQEIRLLNEVAGRMGKVAPIAIRVNPDVDPLTHPYISTGLRENKFGIDILHSFEEYTRAAGLDHIRVAGVSCHIGSQLTQVSPFVDALKRLKVLIDKLTAAGIRISYLDLGGGLGITYDKEAPPHPKEYAAALKEELDMDHLTLILEPGRVIMGNAGILVTRVLYTKSTERKRFVIVDAAMNDLVRPSLYGSYHGIQHVNIKGREKVKVDIVGPICESGDFLAKDREIEEAEPGDLLAVMSAGAYGFTMASNYNSRPRVPEVMVREGEFEIIRERETYEDLVKGERIPDFLEQPAA